MLNLYLAIYLIRSSSRLVQMVMKRVEEATLKDYIPQKYYQLIFFR